MNRREAAQVLELRQMLWPHTPEAADAAVEVDLWAMILGGHDLETVAGAMRARRKDPFPPTIGQLEETIDPQPTYATAWDEFEQMMHRYSTTTPAEEIEWSHPVIAAFAAAGWWRRFGEAPDVLYNAAGLAAFRAHFRDGFSGAEAQGIAQVLQLDAARRRGTALAAGGQRQIEEAP